MFERTRKIIQWVLALGLFFFLSGLANTLISDLGKTAAVSIEKPQALVTVQEELRKNQQAQDQIREPAKLLEEQYRMLLENLRLEDQALRQLVQAKDLLRDPGISKQGAHQLDRLGTLRGSLVKLVQEKIEMDAQLHALKESRLKLADQESKLLAEHQKVIRDAEDIRNLKIFLYRLALTLPLMGLGIWLFIRYRNHRNSPLVYGYSAFALWTFFFGLVPYLPSFGGYVRYAVGIVLVVIGGAKALKYLEIKMAEREKELREKKHLQDKKPANLDNLVRSLKDHRCPSCNHDWMVASQGNPSPGYCPVCSTGLFHACDCGTRTFAFFKNCSNCGKEIHLPESGS